ncbi:MAG TPA: hypothetical protein DIT07_11410 [Sphingobacteriaceae bacterium]|nr:hypothetical protein [Sphingobacteriaceae bacterium]
MKKTIYFLFTALVLSLTAPAAIAKDKKPLDAQTEMRVKQIEARVLEIRSMDKSNLTSSERRDLRKELVQMKKEAKAMTSGGVYLSVGAIIIIILVLILVL